MVRFQKYSEAEWLRAVKMMDQGHGHKLIGRRLNIPADTVRKWVSRYQRYGLVGWDPVSKRQTYSFETKLAAVKALLAGSTRPEAMAEHNIRNQTQLDNWLVAYNAGGEDALRPKPRGRPPASSENETVDQKVSRLEMENAALKKLQALVAAERQPGTK